MKSVTGLRNSATALAASVAAKLFLRQRDVEWEPARRRYSRRVLAFAKLTECGCPIMKPGKRLAVRIFSRLRLVNPRLASFVGIADAGFRLMARSPGTAIIKLVN